MSKSPHIQIERMTAKMTAETEKAVISEYKKALKSIDEEISSLYKKYATDGKLEYADMLKYSRMDNMFKDINKELQKATGETAVQTRQLSTNVFKENYYRTGFVLEKQAQANLSYTLLNPHTVQAAVQNPLSGLTLNERLSKNRGAIITNIKSNITQGLIKGESYEKMANRIKDVLEKDASKANRIVRTEAHRNAIQGQMASYEQAENVGVKINYVWQASIDSSTREDHARMDGVIADMVKGEPVFTFPDGTTTSAPGLSGDPAQDINCRCAVRGQIEGFEPEFRRVRGEDIVPYTTYDEWAKTKEIPVINKQKMYINKVDTSNITPSDKEILPQTLADKISTLKSRAASEDLGHADIINLGNDGAKEMFKEELDDIKTLKAANDDVIKVRKEMDVIGNALDEKEVNVSSYRRGLGKSGYTEKDYNSDIIQIDQLKEKFKSAEANYDEVRSTYAMLNSQLDFYKNDPDVLRDFVGNYRQVGYTSDIDKKALFLTKAGEAREVVEAAFNYYPTDWIKDSIKQGELTTRKVQRGSYSPWSQTISISGNTYKSKLKTSLHELGHRFEETSGLLKYEKSFYDYRTSGETLKWLGGGYDKSEVSRFDNWLDAYTGKDYGGSAYEIISVGFEQAYTNPVDFYVRDPEHFNFCLGLLLAK